MGAIRPAHRSDIPRILDLSCAVYGFDNPMLGAAWLEKVLKDENSLVLLGKHSFGIGSVFKAFYWKKPRGYILQVASQPTGLSREALRVVQQLVAWTKQKGCFEVIMGSEIGTDYGPFAEILGASRAAPSYVVRFDKEPEYA